MRRKLAKFAIPVSITLLIALVAILGRNLWLDLRALSTAGNENAQWTILQLDTEFANLHSVLLEEVTRAEPDQIRVRLRTDLALSRVDLVGRGNAAEIILGDERGTALLSEIQEFAEDAAAISRDEITEEDLRRLVATTQQIRPVARELALIGISRGAERTEMRRQEFANKLRNTGLIAIGVIGALGLVLLALNRLLWIARERDEALRESTAMLASTVSVSLDAIIVGDHHGEIIDVNEAAEDILGWKKHEVLGKRIQGTILPEEISVVSGEPRKNGHVPDFQELLDQGRIESMGLRRTGELFPAELNITSVSNPTGNLVVVYLRDISVRKLNERALLDAKENAERTDRAKSQLLAIISHELRTPLNGILGVIDLLRGTELSQKQRRYLDVAAASGEIMLEQVNEALDITRIETNSLILSPRVFNLAHRIEQVTGMLEPLAIEKGLRLDVDIDPGMSIDFVSDENRIAQMVTNLIGNAIKFTHHGSIGVTVEGIHSAGVTVASITVSDTGDGIPEEKIETIFEDFVVLSRSRGRLSRGDGLGLPISRKIARMMGGDITANSQEGKGSIFVLKIPLERATERSSELGKERPPSSQTREQEKKNLHVLIVEDNQVNRAVLSDMLEGMGHSIEGAQNGRDGLEMAMRKGFDLILMDISLPEMDGIQVTQSIRQTEGPNSDTRIHGLTAYGEDEYSERAIAAGMDGFSTKPIRTNDLDRILRGQATRPKSANLKSGALDEAVFAELLDALGQSRLSESLQAFFREMSEFLSDVEVLPASGAPDQTVQRLHRLRGAAALFGLRTLAEGIESARKSAELGDTAESQAAFRRMSVLTEDARNRVLQLLPETT